MSQASQGPPLPGPTPSTPTPSTSTATPSTSTPTTPSTSSGESRGSYTQDLVDGVNYRVINGKRLNSKLVVTGGRCYTLDKKCIQKSGVLVQYLKCKYKTCKGRASITGRRLTTNTDPEHAHNCQDHGSNTSHWRALECLHIMKERAAKETSKLQNIYNEVLLDESNEVRAELTLKKCTKSMYDARMKLIPPCPNSMEEVIQKLENKDYPESYQKIYLGHVKWQVNPRSQSGRRRGRKCHYCIIVGDPALIETVIRIATFFFGDATFKIVCRQARNGSARSAQVLNILADYQGKAVCILQIIMTCRKYPMYKAVCEKIKAMFPDFQPHFFQADYEAAFRKAIQTTWPDTRILGCRFHFAKCLFGKLKTKFRLAGYYRRTGSVLQQRLSLILRQYFALPLLKHQHMRGQLERLERELRSISRQQTHDVAKRLNSFHNYVVSYWMCLQGAYTISVEGVEHKTNNVAERFNQKLASEMPQHPSLFKFLNCVQTSVIGNGFSIVAQADGGRNERTKLGSAAKHLLEAAIEVERRYKEGDISAQDVLVAAAAHFDDNKVAEALIIYARSLEETQLASEEDEDDESEDETEENGQPDISQPVNIVDVNDLDVNERELELQRDPDLRDVDLEEWVTTEWPIITGNIDQLLPNRVLDGERLEEVAVVVCSVCYVAHDNLVNFDHKDCSHIICSTCYSMVTECPTCKAPKGLTPGKKINVSSLMIARRQDVESNYGVTEEMMQAAAQVTRRTGDETEYEFFQRRNREAIREALLEDGQDPDLQMANLSQHSNNTTATTESLPSSPVAPPMSPLSTPPSSPRPTGRGRGRGRGNGRATSRRGGRGRVRAAISQQQPEPGPREVSGPQSQPATSRIRSRSPPSRVNRPLRTDEIRRLIEATDSEEEFQL